jgi:hypothetical protein
MDIWWIIHDFPHSTHAIPVPVWFSGPDHEVPAELPPEAQVSCQKIPQNGQIQ